MLMKNPTDTITYPAHIAPLNPYIPGVPIADLARRKKIDPGKIAKLASNENPLGPSPAALQALAAKNIDFSRYPDNNCTELVSALALFHDVPEEWIVIGAGSESVIANTVATVLAEGRKTAYSQFSFQAYINAAQKVGAQHIVVPSPEFVVDLDALYSVVDQDPSLIYIANPGNPTGTCLNPGDLMDFMSKIPKHIVVLLDEAYFEFLPDSFRPDSIVWVRLFPNLIITRTFSKAYGLAGLRIGYGIAQQGLADMLRRVRPPFTVSESAQIAAIAALQDTTFLENTLRINQESKSLLTDGLRARGYRYLESETNFLLVNVGDGVAWTRAMEKHGLIVRPVNSYGLPAWVRISLGMPDEMRRLFDAMDTFTPNSVEDVSL
ncbi:histidinol-phosphate aminotransferase [Advenella mimigardefordensis DPN7]|uniref:Histidinol-phosphate aminotransferase n=2 Tax=Advenella mimigardefordensis TaxID=302406 RepID=W0PED5_ADVMD|nr:histidinol-phosphate aminotransferase [Advenella mimigardefordensis DPN7]